MVPIPDTLLKQGYKHCPPHPALREHCPTPISWEKSINPARPALFEPPVDSVEERGGGACVWTPIGACCTFKGNTPSRNCKERRAGHSVIVVLIREVGF